MKITKHYVIMSDGKETTYFIEDFKDYPVQIRNQAISIDVTINGLQHSLYYQVKKGESNEQFKKRIDNDFDELRKFIAKTKIKKIKEA